MNIAEAKEIIGGNFGFAALDADEILRKIGLPKNSKVLDVGTGHGIMAITLALNGHQVFTGEPEMDVSIYAKQSWHDDAKKVNVAHFIEYQPFDAADIPFEDSFFDAVFCLGTFHHIAEENRLKVLKEFIRTTKPKAVICLFEPNQSLLKKIKESDPAHPDTADPNEYRRQLNLTFRKIPGANLDAFVLQK